MCAHNACGHGSTCQAECTPCNIICSDKHTSTCEEIEISTPNLSVGGSLHSPTIILFQ